jgi:2-polyprenyl-3-methyl-5-hydroxy-6-metoxy-1,4-benzoquinol methylase
MSACCEPQGYDRIFDDREARRAGSRYRRTGLAALPRRTVGLYRDGAISGDSLLEIGGGVGDLQIEMLKAGVRTAVGVDMSPAYDDVAAELLAEAGLTDRVERRTGDVVAHPELAAPADVVVMHSVVCCYADVRGLLAVAAAHARRYLVVSFPRHSWWLRSAAPFMNVYPRVRHSDWRFYVHPESAILDAVADAGMRLVRRERLRFDHHAVFARE